jgi:prepilin-type N-terminal cleavage/methylation domain-containing protein
MDKKQIAFTLIELLVVIAIVGILSGLIVVSTNSMTQKASLAKAQMFSSSLRNALMANIVGEWKLDDASGTAASETWTKVSNGTLYNFATTTAGYGDSNTSGWMSSSNCISGTCLKFDGTDDYIEVVGSDSTSSALAVSGPITLSTWVKFLNTSTTITIMGRGIGFASTANRGYSIGRISSNLIKFFIYSSSAADTDFVSTTAITDSDWHFVAATWDGTTGTNGKKIYIDGKLDAQGTSTISALSQPAYAFRIGRNGDTFTYYFDGLIDEARVYSAAIPSSQIKEQYYAGINKLLAKGAISNQEYTERMSVVGYSR